MSIRAARICVFAIVIAGGFTFAHSAAANVVFMVNTTDDGVDAVLGGGVCSTSVTRPAPPNTCTLRAAVMEANRTTGAGATIMLPAGLYNLAIGAHDADGEDNGDLNLSVPSGYTPGPTTITGAGAAVTIIDAQQIDRVLTVDANRTVSISGVTIRNGFSGGNGGGINNAGVLTLTGSALSTNSSSSGGGIYNAIGGNISASHCTLSGNTTDGFGGGVANYGLLNISYSTLSGNNAPQHAGGGIYNFFSALILENSTLSGNTAAFGGGFSSGGGSSSVSQSTISGNSAQAYGALLGYGGGIYIGDGFLSVTNSTIALNNSDADGGGIYNYGSTNTNVNIYSSTIVYNDADHVRVGGLGGGILVTGSGGNGVNVYNTVLAFNTMSNAPIYDDCDTVSGGTLATHARNLFGTTDGCTIVAVSGSYATLLGSLGGLQRNGGPTQTIALLAGSNAIDGTSVTGSTCGDASILLVVDQRGYPRTGACDVGAFEYDDIFIDGFQ